ncbi:MAG: M3 family oligoendopeptidase [Nanoarchaeota archaeon]
MENLQTLKTEWDLSHLEEGKSFEEKREEWEDATQRFVQKWKNKKDYLENPAILKEALDDYEKWSELYGPSSDEFSSPSSSDEVYYFWLKTQIDQNNPDLKAKFNKIEELGRELGNSISFFKINLSQISFKKQEEFLDSPELGKYKHFLKRIFQRTKHMLGEKGEEIISLKSSSSYSYWEKMVSGFLSKEEREVLDEDGNLIKAPIEKLLSLIRNKNKKIRDYAAKAFNDILNKYVDVAESEINAILENKKADDKLRGFPRPDSERHLSDDIKTDTVDSLVKTVTKRFYISREFYKLRAKLIKQDKLEYHERSVDYGAIDKNYSYEDSIKLIDKVFRELDSKFSELLNIFVNNGLVDVYTKKGKRSGAFCVHISKSQPTYIMLNHTNKLKDVTTFAHELGHGINNELAKRQHSLYFDTSTATAEVASTFMEDFVLQELMKNADDELKLSLIIAKLDDDISSIIRQIAGYNFEKELHEKFREKGFLSKDEIGKLFLKHMGSYLGDYVELSPGSENWWVYWHHMRLYFYVYSYASGLLISKALQRKVKENPKFIENVKNFLSMGISKSSEEMFRDMGVELNEDFWNSGLDEVESLLKEAENLAKKLGKI